MDKTGHLVADHYFMIAVRPQDGQPGDHLFDLLDGGVGIFSPVVGVRHFRTDNILEQRPFDDHRSLLINKQDIAHVA